jgi:hypothetical protein
MFHVWGLVAGLTCLQDNRVQVRGPGSSAPSGKLVIEIMAVVDIHCIYAPLIIFDDIVNNHSDDLAKALGRSNEHCSLEVCQSSCYPPTILTFLGPLALATGNFLARRMNVSQVYSSSKQEERGYCTQNERAGQ